MYLLPSSRPHGIILAGVLLAAFSTPAAHADLFYLKTGAGGTNWNIPGDWNSLPDGTGTNATVMAENEFNLNGNNLGTPSGSSTFDGALLIFNGGSLTVRGTTPNHVINSANATGGSRIISQDSTGRTLTINSFNNISGTTLLEANAGGTSAFLATFNFGTLSGAGNLSLNTTATGASAAAKTISLGVTNGSAFTGNLTWSDDDMLTLQFTNNAVFGGGLIALSTSRISLDYDLTFASVNLGGTSLTPGFYSFETLNTSFGDIFIDGGVGSITVVPEPSGTAIGLLGMSLCLVTAGRSTRRRRGDPRLA